VHVGARAKWREVVAIYKNSGLNIASSADVGAIARYCQVYGEYYDLLEQRERLKATDCVSEDELEGELGCDVNDRRRQRLLEKIDFLVSLSGLLQVDSAINKKMDQILKLEDRLFLNPLAKVRNVPKHPAKHKEQSPLEAAGFGGI